MATKNKNGINPEISPFLQEDEVMESVSEEAVVEEKKTPKRRVSRSASVSENESGRKENSSKNKRNYWEFGLLVFVALVLIVAVGFLIFLAVKKVGNPEAGKVSIQNISKTESQTKEEISEKAPVEKEAETPKAVNPMDVSIKILNGGAIGGSAGKVKEVLALKGYKKIEVGNSDKSNYVGVNVFYQGDGKVTAEKVATDLKTKYPTAAAKLGVSVEEKSSSIVIILGK
jgi:cytoskeletal protein RodZ